MMIGESVRGCVAGLKTGLYSHGIFFETYIPFKSALALKSSSGIKMERMMEAFLGQRETKVKKGGFGSDCWRS